MARRLGATDEQLASLETGHYIGFEPSWRVALEYDGRGKYAGGAPDALVREKRRQDAITEAGWRLVRVTWADLRDPGGLVRRVLRAVPAGAVGALQPRRLLGQPGWC